MLSPRLYPLPCHPSSLFTLTALQAEQPQFLSRLSCLCLLPGSQAARGTLCSGLSDGVRATPNPQLPRTPGWLSQKCLEPSARHCSLRAQCSCLGAPLAAASAGLHRIYFHILCPLLQSQPPSTPMHFTEPLRKSPLRSRTLTASLQWH